MISLASFCDYGFRESALWCPLTDYMKVILTTTYQKNSKEINLSTNSRNVFGECEWFDFWQQVPCLSSQNWIWTISTDHSFQVNHAELKHLKKTRFLKKVLFFTEAGSLLGPPGNYLLKWMWQQHWGNKFNGGNEANLGKVETEQCSLDKAARVISQFE